jgi:hypothetical protein
LRLSRVAFGLRGAAPLIAILASVSPLAARADTTTLATEAGEANSVVLWKEGAAWWGSGGIRFAAAGSAPRLLAPFPELGGLAYYRVLDGGAGAGGTTGALAYGWNEVNEQTPPMGPGDTEVPSPPIPYETNVLQRGVIAADGTAIKLSDCGVAYAFPVPGQEISLSGNTLAYACGEYALTGQNTNYLSLANASAPGTAQSKVTGVNGAFQLSGHFIAYDAGERFKAGKVIVRNVSTNAIAYEFPQAPTRDGEALALQEDGSLVVLGQGTSSCPMSNEVRLQTSPAEWFPISSPVAHQLGCFYDGAVRPVDGKWVALAPGPGSKASLVLVDLTTGSQTTLATFLDPGMFEPQQRPVTPGADFDGTRLAWTLKTCAGVAVQLAPDIHAMSPGPASLDTCPVQFHVHGRLHSGPRGNVRVAVSCPFGCKDVFLAIRQPRALANEFAGFFSLPASPKARVESFHISRRDLAYVRRHHRVRITLMADVERPGGGKTLRYTTQATLVS